MTFLSYKKTTDKGEGATSGQRVNDLSKQKGETLVDFPFKTKLISTQKFNVWKTGSVRVLPCGRISYVL